MITTILKPHIQVKLFEKKAGIIILANNENSEYSREVIVEGVYNDCSLQKGDKLILKEGSLILKNSSTGEDVFFINEEDVIAIYN